MTLLAHCFSARKKACSTVSATSVRGCFFGGPSFVRVLGAASHHSSRTDGSASERGAPGTLSAVSPAEMDVWAEPRAGGAAPTPI
jgi:hypothetical protein